MSSAPGEPEKYSIDEIMERLKSSPSENPEDGELVTRSDGTQAIRVRKRKRRSSQPHKEQSLRSRRSRIIQVTLAFSLIILAVLAVGAGVIFANSKPFRDGLIDKIGQASGAKPELSQFRMNPQAAIASTLNLDWPGGSVLKNLFLRGASAEVFPTSFFGKTMNGEEATFAEGTLTLQFPKEGDPSRFTPAVDGDLPVRFKRYRTPTLNLKLDGPDGSVFSLWKTEASLSMQTVSGIPQLRLYRGELGVRGWPKLRMDRALIEFRGNETEIVGLRLQHETDDVGALAFSGTIAPYKPGQTSSLSVSVESFPISGIAGPPLARLISGRIESVSSTRSNYLSFKPSDDASPKMEIAFGVTPTSTIEVQGFPFLIGLSQLLDGDEWFEKPVFESDATGEIHREKGVVSFQNLYFENKARMALRGNLALAANQSLSGTLKIGIPETMIPKTSRLQTILGPIQDGFRWVDVTVSGTATAPADDFKDIYSKAEAVRQPAPGEPGPEGTTFEELTRPR